MSDIVERLALMPIGEWEEARVEILRLRGLLDNAHEATPLVVESSEEYPLLVEEEPNHSQVEQDLYAELGRVKADYEALYAKHSAVIAASGSTLADLSALQDTYAELTRQHQLYKDNYMVLNKTAAVNLAEVNNLTTKLNEAEAKVSELEKALALSITPLVELAVPVSPKDTITSRITKFFKKEPK